MKIPIAILCILIVSIIFAGCVEIGNVKIKVTKYVGDCVPPVYTTPCCDSYIQKDFPLIVDGKEYETDWKGDLVLKLEKNTTYIIGYQGCEGENRTLEFSIAPDGKITYEKTIVYGNAAHWSQNVTSSELIELNIPCCTA